MRQLDGLYLLIKRLSKSEKRYISLYGQTHQGDRVYWTLYELIQQENGDDARVRAAFGRQYGADKFEAARKHLFAVLLKCLRQYQAEGDLETKLSGQLDEARILFEKGLEPLALAQLRAVQQAAAQHELPTVEQRALALELTYLMQTGFRGETEEGLIDRHEQIGLLLRQQTFTHQHEAINHLLLFRYFQRGLTRSRTDDQSLNDLLLEEHRINAIPHRSSLTARRWHLHFQAAFLLMTGDYADGRLAYQELNDLFALPAQPATHPPQYYSYLIDGILTGLRSVRDYAAMRAFIHTIEAQVGQQPGRVVGLPDLLLGHQMSLLLDQQQPAEALAIYAAQSPPDDGEATVGLTHGRTLLLFYGACAHFGLGQFSASLRLVNRLLRVPQTLLSLPVYTALRLFELVVHVELGSDEHLLYKIRSVEWKLRSQNRLFKAERLVLSMLRQAAQHGWQHPALRPDLEALQALGTSAYENRLNQFFNFTAWVSGRVDGDRR